MSPVDHNVTQVRQHNDKSSLKISTKLCTHNRTTFTVTSSCMCVRSAYYNKDELYRLRDCFLCLLTFYLASFLPRQSDSMYRQSSVSCNNNPTTLTLPSHMMQYGRLSERERDACSVTGAGLLDDACTGQSSVSCESNTSQMSQNRRGARFLGSLDAHVTSRLQPSTMHTMHAYHHTTTAHRHTPQPIITPLAHRHTPQPIVTTLAHHTPQPIVTPHSPSYQTL